MAAFTRADGRRANVMVRGGTPTLTEMFMRGNGRMTTSMGKVSTRINQVEHSIEVSAVIFRICKTVIYEKLSFLK